MRGLLFIGICLSWHLLDSQGTKAQMSAETLELDIPGSCQYFLYLPTEYKEQPDEVYPLVLFLHGGGESGSDIEKVKKHGPPAQIASGMDLPFILVAPQNPSPKGLWDDTAVMHLLDEVMESHRVDRQRVYLTGLSRGAYGAWRLAIQYPDRFAALVAISGEAPMNYAPWLGKMPVWVFHGENDRSIDVSSSDRMVRKLRELGSPVKYTRYNNTGHDAWTATYNNPKIYQWMLKQKRPETSVARD